jgi:uncharacterized membrane protein YkgB
MLRIREILAPRRAVLPFSRIFHLVTFELSNYSKQSTKMETSTLNKTQPINAGGQNLIIRFSAWVNDKNLPFVVISGGMIVMLLWAGAYKMTAPGADGIVPLVNNNPLISWHFKLFGVYHGSDIIGLTEMIAALLMIAGMFKPQAGVVGGTIAALMFFITSTMVITTPGALTAVNGFNYMSFLGLFLFKDILNLGGSLYLITKYGHMAILAQHKNN